MITFEVHIGAAGLLTILVGTPQALGTSGHVVHFHWMGLHRFIHRIQKRGGHATSV